MNGISVLISRDTRGITPLPRDKMRGWLTQTRRKVLSKHQICQHPNARLQAFRNTYLPFKSPRLWYSVTAALPDDGKRWLVNHKCLPPYIKLAKNVNERFTGCLYMLIQKLLWVGASLIRQQTFNILANFVRAPRTKILRMRSFLLLLLKLGWWRQGLSLNTKPKVWKVSSKHFKPLWTCLCLSS